MQCVSWKACKDVVQASQNCHMMSWQWGTVMTRHISCRVKLQCLHMLRLSRLERSSSNVLAIRLAQICNRTVNNEYTGQQACAPHDGDAGHSVYAVTITYEGCWQPCHIAMHGGKSCNSTGCRMCTAAAAANSCGYSSCAKWPQHSHSLQGPAREDRAQSAPYGRLYIQRTCVTPEIRILRTTAADRVTRMTPLHCMLLRNRPAAQPPAMTAHHSSIA